MDNYSEYKNNTYYKALSNSEFCVMQDFDSLFTYHLSKNPDEVLNDKKEFDEFAKAFFVYSNSFSESEDMIHYNNLNDVKKVLQKALNNVIKNRLFERRVVEPICNFFFDANRPVEQSDHVIHKLAVMGCFSADRSPGYMLINRLLKRANEFSRNEIPDSVNKALEFYYGKKVDYTDNTQEKEFENSIRSYLDDPDLFVEKFNELSDLEKVFLHEVVENSKELDRAPFFRNGTGSDPSFAKKTDEWLNLQIADFYQGSRLNFEHLVYESVRHDFVPTLSLNDHNVKNNLQNQTQSKKHAFHL